MAFYELRFWMLNHGLDGKAFASQCLILNLVVFYVLQSHMLVDYWCHRGCILDLHSEEAPGHREDRMSLYIFL
jgi:hypothetical protein